MKKFNKLIAVFTLILCFALSLSGCGGTAKKINLSHEATTVNPVKSVNSKKVSALPTQLGVDEDTAEKFLMNYTEVARNKSSILYADREKGLFALQDIETEKIWYSTPNNSELDELTSGTERLEMRSQLLVYYILKSEEGTVSSYKIENSQSGCVASDGIKVTNIENGIRVDYTFKKSKFTVPVKYYLTDDGFRAEILADEIDEGDTAYLIGINLLPTFGAGDWNTKGQLFVPDGSGALIDFNGHNVMSAAYNRTVYGNEKTVKSVAEKLTSQDIKMPVFGTITGGNTLMGIISDGDTSASISVIYGNDSCGYNAVSSVFNYRTSDYKEMYSKQGGINSTLYRVSDIHSEAKLFAVEYRMLNGSSSGYVGMAKQYREWLTENGKLEKKETKPLFNLEVYGAAELSTSFLGVNYRKTQVLTTVEQAKEIASRLKERGMSELGIRYVGFTGSGILNSDMDTSASPIGKLGGKKDIAALAKEAMLYLDYDVMQIRSGNSAASVSKDITRTVFDYKSEQLSFSRSVYSRLTDEDTVYLLNAPTVYSVTKKIIENSLKNKYENISYSNLASTYYSDFSSKNAIYRDGMANYAEALLAESDKAFGSVAAEAANAYAFKSLDRIWNTPIYSSGYDIFKTDVPFYQLVLHGSVALTVPCVIQSQTPEVTILKAVETGSELLFACSYETSTKLIGSRFEQLYSTQWENWIDYAAEVYEEYMPLLNKIHSSEIVSHSEVADGVFVTGYANGVSVAVNYNTRDVKLSGGATVKAMSFTELQGGAVK